MFRLNLIIPFIVVSAFMFSTTIMAVYYFQEEAVHKNKKQVKEKLLKTLDGRTKLQGANLLEHIQSLKKDKSLEEFFQLEMKKELYDASIEQYTRMNNNLGLTHWYFLKPSGEVFLRVHDYQRDGDIIGRTTFKKACEQQSSFYGLEFGIKKNYTLRVVEPWIVNGELIGYIELGKEIDKFLDSISKLLNTQVYLVVKKEVFRYSPTYVFERLQNKVQTKRHYVVYQTHHHVPKQIEDIVEGDMNNQDIDLDGKEYFVAKSVLSDVSNKDLGYIVFLHDVTFEHDVLMNTIQVLALILGVLALAVLLIGIVLLQKRENAINSLTQKLHEKRKTLKGMNLKLEKLFDLQKNIVILSNSYKLHMANKMMFEFFGYKNITEFVKDYDCICEHFIEDDVFFHLGKVKDGELWIRAMKRLPHQEHIVAMVDKKGKEHIFTVSINEFDKDEYIVSFSDITDTHYEQNKLRYKAHHDQLTQAYNRAFFENNIDRIIEDASAYTLGIAICDIDYFKKINDTCGHKRGDIVLQEFAKLLQRSIRKDDYLIRWGGEEFIIMMNVEDIMVLEKAIESIRKKIEDTYFEEVEHITSSFGVTLHNSEGESIEQCIERADEALYQAKQEGRNCVRII